MKLKYVICPGWVTSKTDGQRHYIGASMLIALYGVDPKKCETHEPASWWTPSHYRMAEQRQKWVQRLGPRSDGNYKLDKQGVPNENPN